MPGKRKRHVPIETVLTKERLKQEGKTILLTSHQHEYLEKLCDVIYCIHDNKIVPFTDEFKERYFGL